MALAAAPVALHARGAFYDEYPEYYTEDNEVCLLCSRQLGGYYCHAEPLEECVGQLREQCVDAPAVQAASASAVAAAVAVCLAAAGASNTTAPFSPLTPAVWPPRIPCEWGATTVAPVECASLAIEMPAVCPLRNPCGWGATPVAFADWAKLQADPVQLWGPPEAFWAATAGALPAAQRTVANPFAVTEPSRFPWGREVEEVLTSPAYPLDDFPPNLSPPDLVGQVVQAEAEVRFLI